MSSWTVSSEPRGIGIDRRGRETACRHLPTPRSRSHRRHRHQKYQPRLPRRRSDPATTVGLRGTPRRSPRYNKSCPRSRTGGPLVCVWHKQAPQHHLPAQARPRWRLAPLDGAAQGLVDHRLVDPLPRSRAPATTATLAGAGFVVAAQAALPAANSTAAAVAAAVEAPTALAANTAPTVPRAALPAAAMAAPPAAAAPAPLAAVPPAGDSVPLFLLLLTYTLPLPFSSSPRWSEAR